MAALHWPLLALQLPVDLRLQLRIAYDLKEGVLFRRRQEAGPAGRVPPHSDQVSVKSGPRRTGCKRRVEFLPLPRSAIAKGGIQQHHDHGDVIDIQLRGGKGCQ
jgi:hypothetical protein